MGLYQHFSGLGQVQEMHIDLEKPQAETSLSELFSLERLVAILRHSTTFATMFSSIQALGSDVLSFKHEWNTKQPIHSLTAMLAVLLAILLSYYLISSTYLLYFHPLSQFPGPRPAALSTRWVLQQAQKGMPEEEFERLHEKHSKKTLSSKNCLIHR
jgi:hypothetical protein